jgi:hypothetical protein
MPENEGKVIILLALFGELNESCLSRVRIQKVDDETVDVVLVVCDGQARAQSVGKGMGIVDELRNWRVRGGVCDSGSDSRRGVRIQRTLIGVVAELVVHSKVSTDLRSRHMRWWQ